MVTKHLFNECMIERIDTNWHPFHLMNCGPEIGGHFGDQDKVPGTDEKEFSERQLVSFIFLSCSLLAVI